VHTGFLSELSLPNLTVLPHDVSTNGFPEGSFGLVHVRAVLMHIADRMAAARRMASWLAPGGWLVAEEADFGMWLADYDSLWAAHPAAWHEVSRTGRWARAGSCCGRSASWAWPASALTPSSISSSPERRWRSSAS